MLQEEVDAVLEGGGEFLPVGRVGIGEDQVGREGILNRVKAPFVLLLHEVVEGGAVDHVGGEADADGVVVRSQGDLRDGPLDVFSDVAGCCK